MLLTILFCLVNVLFGFFGRHIIKFSGFEISPAAIAILAWHGESVLFGGLLLPVSYALSSWRDMRYVWLTIPVTLLIGFLAGFIHNIYVLAIIYHIIGAFVNYFLQSLDVKYIMYILMNLAMNFSFARIYGLV